MASQPLAILLLRSTQRLLLSLCPSHPACPALSVSDQPTMTCSVSALLDVKTATVPPSKLYTRATMLYQLTSLQLAVLRLCSAGRLPLSLYLDLLVRLVQQLSFSDQPLTTHSSSALVDGKTATLPLSVYSYFSHSGPSLTSWLLAALHLLHCSTWRPSLQLRLFLRKQMLISL